MDFPKDSVTEGGQALFNMKQVCDCHVKAVLRLNVAPLLLCLAYTVSAFGVTVCGADMRSPPGAHF